MYQPEVNDYITNYYRNTNRQCNWDYEPDDPRISPCRIYVDYVEIINTWTYTDEYISSISEYDMNNINNEQLDVEFDDMYDEDFVNNGEMLVVYSLKHDKDYTIKETKRRIDIFLQKMDKELIKMKEKKNKIHKELVEWSWSPNNIEKWCEWKNY